MITAGSLLQAKRAYVVVRDTVRDYETLEKRLAEAERRLFDARAHVHRQKLRSSPRCKTCKCLCSCDRKTEISSCVNCTSRHKRVWLPKLAPNPSGMVSLVYLWSP